MGVDSVKFVVVSITFYRTCIVLLIVDVVKVQSCEDSKINNNHCAIFYSVETVTCMYLYYIIMYREGVLLCVCMFVRENSKKIYL